MNIEWRAQKWNRSGTLLFFILSLMFLILKNNEHWILNDERRSETEVALYHLLFWV